MTLQINPIERTLTLSVQDLLREPGYHSPGFYGVASLKRLWVGQGIHQSYQWEQEKKRRVFEKEVFVQTTFPFSGWQVTLQGRIDGLIHLNHQRVRIEEVKSLHFDRDLPRIHHGSLGYRYRWQSLCYAYLYEKMTGKSAEVHLVLIDVKTHEEEREYLPYETHRVEGFIFSHLERIIQKLDALLLEKQKKQAQAGDIPFPHPHPRPIQDKIIQAVTQALETRQILLVEAPTGVGKTAGVLYPALRYSLKKGKRLAFLTHTTLQQRLAVETLKAMNKRGIFKSLQIRAKAKMCANSVLICHEDYCPYAYQYSEKMEATRLDEKIKGAFHHWDPDEIYALATQEKVCPFEVSLELFNDADVVICDYNYLFDPRIAFWEEEDLKEWVIVVDEVHNLVDRARQYYSPELSVEAVEEALTFSLTLSPDLQKPLQSILNPLKETLEGIITATLGEEAEEKPLPPLDRPFHPFLLDFEGIFLDYLSEALKRGLPKELDPVRSLYYQLIHWAQMEAQRGDHLVWLAQKKEEKTALRIFCLDPSQYLGAKINKAHGFIGLSATLHPFDFYMNLLGVDPDRTMGVDFPSPFPKENLLILILPTFDTTYRKRKEGAPQLARTLHQLSQIIPGNLLLLFPSFEYLSLVMDLWPSGGKTLLIQEPQMDLKARNQVIHQLKDKGDYLLVGVTGGIFSEGMDYPGRMLQGAIIVSPSLPQVSLEQNLLRAYFKKHYQSGFAYAYLVPGMRRVVQAGGRVIRSSEDRGIILLVGKRFSYENYQHFFPRYWYDQSPKELIQEDPMPIIKQFWNHEA